MKYSLFEVNNDYLHFEIIGNYSLEDGKRIIGEIYNLCIAKKFNKLLVDITKKNGVISTADRFVLSEFISGLISYKIKLAVIGKKDQIDKFSETVAYNRGSSLRIFSDKKEAIEWLMKL